MPIQKALTKLAAKLSKLFSDVLLLNAFGHNVHFQIVAQRHNRA